MVEIHLVIMTTKTNNLMDSSSLRKIFRPKDDRRYIFTFYLEQPQLYLVWKFSVLMQ